MRATRFHISSRREDPGIPLASIRVLSGETSFFQRSCRKWIAVTNPRSHHAAVEGGRLQPIVPAVPRCASEARPAACAGSSGARRREVWRTPLCSGIAAMENPKASESHRGDLAYDQDPDTFGDDSVGQELRAKLRQPEPRDVLVSNEVEDRAGHHRQAAKQRRGESLLR